MKIFITLPAFSINGGIRVALEIANRLTQWHDVTICVLTGSTDCQWFAINPKVNITTSTSMAGMDCLLITSPHGIPFQDAEDCPKKVFLHLQMMESMFKPNDKEWLAKCQAMYNSPHPMFSISKWNMQAMNRIGLTYYIGNGVNYEHFPISHKPKSGNVVLIEGWEGYNPAKDVEMIAPKVANMLRKKGYRIVVFGQKKLNTLRHIPHEYHYRPSLEKMNELYERATILLKASKYDARACGPMEAMTKGTVCARAIIKGDDDLTDGINCLKVGYNVKDLYAAAFKLLNSPALRQQLAANGYQHLQANSWDRWINYINDVITTSPVSEPKFDNIAINKKMSSKASLFLTNDNEHAYFETNEPAYSNEGNFVGDALVLEFSKKNIEVLCNDSEDLVIQITPGTEIYNELIKIKKFDELQRANKYP